MLLACTQAFPQYRSLLEDSQDQNFDVDYDDDYDERRILATLPGQEMSPQNQPNIYTWFHLSNVHWHV